MSNKLLDEKELINKAKTNPEHFNKIYNHYFSKIYNYVRYRVKKTDLADDLTSKIFFSSY